MIYRTPLARVPVWCEDGRVLKHPSRPDSIMETGSSEGPEGSVGSSNQWYFVHQDLKAPWNATVELSSNGRLE